MKKKILFIINNLGGGGAERLVIDDINEMVLRGFDVYLITLRPEFKTTIESELKINPENKFLIDFQKIFNLKAWIAMVKLLRKIKPDLILSHLWLANTVGRISAFFAGIRNIVCFEQNVYDSVKTKKMFFIDFILQFFCKKVVAVSVAVKKSLINHCIFPKKITVIYNSVDINKYRNSYSIRSEIGVTEEDFVFVFVGRLIKQKGVDILIKSFKNVSNGILLVVGQGDMENDLKNMVKNYGLEKRVKFLGFRSNIENILKSSDCFVFPSRFEGLGIVVLEAMSTPLPIVITDFDAGLEMLENNKSAIIVSVDDIDALSSSMNNVYNNKDLRLSLKENAFLRAKDFSIENHVNSIINFL